MRKLLYGFLALLMLVTGCSEKPPVVSVPVDAPVMVSSDPADGVTGLTGDKLTMKLTYDQNIKCPSDQQKNVRL